MFSGLAPLLFQFFLLQAAWDVEKKVKIASAEQQFLEKML